MRLHLPKRLLRAVLTALVTTSAALLGLGSTAYAGFYENTFYLNGDNEKDFHQTEDTYSYLTNTWDSATNTWSNQYGTYRNGKYTLNTNPSGFTDTQLINTISTGERTFATIETLNVTDNKSLSIGAGGKGVFTGTGLVIEDFVIANSGTATLTVGNESECHKVTINSVTGTLNISNYSNLTFAGGESAINLGTVALNGGSITNTGTLNLTGAVSMTEAYVKGYIMGDLATGTKNGFGTFSSIALSDLFKGGGTVTVGDSVSWTMGGSALTYTAASQSFSLANALTSTVYQVHSNYTIGAEVNGATSIQIYGEEGNPTTLRLDGSLPGTIKRITANANTVYDVYGVKDKDSYELILNGGKLTNSSSEILAGSKQLCKMSLTANSTLEATSSHTFGYVANGYGDATLNLGECTLTKTGDGEFYTAKTTLRGGGTLKITDGKFTLGVTHEGNVKTSYLGHTGDTANTNIWLTGGELAGSFVVQRDAEIKAEDGSGRVSASITLSNEKTATLKATGESDILTVESGVLSGAGKVKIAAGSGKVYLNGNNAYTGGTTMEGGTLVAGHASALGTGALSTTNNSTTKLSVASGVNLGVRSIDLGMDATMTIDGNVTVSGGVDVSEGNYWRKHLIISGGTTTVGGNVWICYASDVQISKDAALAVGGFKFTGNTESTSGKIVKSTTNTTTQIVLNSTGDFETAKFENMDIAYSGNTARTLKAELNNVALSTAAGAGKLTLAREGGVTLTGLTANSDVELATATKVTGITNIKQGATLSVSDAQSSLNKLSGTGKLSASVNQTLSLNTDTSNLFTGTLETTGGKLNVTGGTDYVQLAGMVANGGNLDLLSSANVTISEVLSIGNESTVGVYTGTTTSPKEEGKVFVHGFPSGKAQLTVGTDSTLNADLSLSNAILTFNGGALTLGSSLTLLSGNELQGSIYTDWNGSGTLDLFTGVDSLTLGSGDTAITAEVGKTYDASSVFANEGMDNYKLQIVGSTGDYTVQMVKNAPTPEPTTATLSLLALMGLAARRRRKA